MADWLVAVIDILIVGIFGMGFYYMVLYYFKLKKENDTKFLAEGLTVLIAILVSTVTKFVIFILISDARDFDGIFSNVLSALFSAIGGLQFEGLPLIGGDLEGIDSILKTIYYGASLWSGAVFLTIFSFTISVDFVNLISLKREMKDAKTRKIKEKIDTHFYIFTSVTDDALSLAHSINKHYLSRKETCIIIFSGNIGAFDRLNPLCTAIFSSGYIYYPVNTKTGVREKTVLEALGIDKFSDVHMIAFDLNEQSVADDQKNAETVFAETDYKINVLIKALEKDRKELEKIACEYNGDYDNYSTVKVKIYALFRKFFKNTINFYVLTKNETNVRAFEQGIKDNLESKYMSLFSDNELLVKLFDVVWDVFFTKVQITPINEADLAAKDLIEKRMELVCKENLFLFKDNSKDIYKVLSLGFGEKGRAVVSKLFEYSAEVDINGNILPFFVNAVDEYIDSVSGTFLATHPLFVNLKEEITAERSFDDIVRDAVKEKEKEIYGIVENKDGKSLEYNSYPLIRFKKEKCLSQEFFEYIDGKTGIDPKDKTLSYDAIVIALGDDILNIRLANAIIRDISSEYDRNPDCKQNFQIIAVNIRNEQNVRQLEWDFIKLYEEKYDFSVICFGDASELYTYDKIINTEEAKNYSYRYFMQYKKLNSNHEINSLESLCKTICKENKKYTINDVLKGINQYADNENKGFSKVEIEEHWKEEPMLSKKSSLSAMNFKSVYKSYFKDYLELDFNSEHAYQILYNACKLEHERWLRFHISNGFKYGYKTNKVLKKHSNLVKMGDLKDVNVIFDALNVAMIKNEERE